MIGFLKIHKIYFHFNCHCSNENCLLSFVVVFSHCSLINLLTLPIIIFMFSGTAITFTFPLLFLKTFGKSVGVKRREDLVDTLHLYFFLKGTRWHSWLRHCATSRNVASSIPNGVITIFHWHNPSGRTMALRLTQPLTEMSTRNISWG